MDGLTAKNGVMVLRKVLSFKGKGNFVNNFNNTQYNLTSNLYKNLNEHDEIGKNLSLISK